MRLSWCDQTLTPVGNATVEVSGLRVALIASSAQTSVDWFDRSDRTSVQCLLPVWMASGSAPLHGLVAVTSASCSYCIPFHSVLSPSHWLPGFPRQVTLNLDLSVDHRNRHFLLKMWADERSEEISGHGLPDTETEGYQRWSLLRGPSWLVSSLCCETACLSQGCRFLGHCLTRSQQEATPRVSPHFPVTTGTSADAWCLPMHPRAVCWGSALVLFWICVSLILLNIACQISPKKINLIVDVFESVPLAWIL